MIYTAKNFKYYIMTCLSFIVLVVIVNLWVDPQRNVPLQLNSLKPFHANGGRVEKSLKLRQNNYDTIFLGTSRTLMGINPEHRLLANDKVYNMGLPTTNMPELYQVLGYIHREQRLDRLIIGIEMPIFRRGEVGPAYDKSLFNSDWGYRKGLINYLVSFKTFYFSINSLYLNLKDINYKHSNDYGYFDTNGLKIDNRTTFDAELKRALSNKAYAGFEYSEATERLFEERLQQFIDSGTEVIVFMSPLHALQFETYDALGMYPRYESWKRRMVDIVESISENSKAKVQLWDFGGYNSITTEQIPDKNASNQMRYYWEMSHYKSETGALVLNKILGNSLNQLNVPIDFGIKLSKQNIEQHLLNVRQARDLYRAQNPNEIAHFNHLFRLTEERRTMTRKSLLGVNGKNQNRPTKNLAGL